MTYEEEQRMLRNYRGRRLLACRAADSLSAIVDHLGKDDGIHPPPPGGTLPEPPTNAMRRELDNAVSVLLRMILAYNDGGLSPSYLQRF